MSIQRENLRQKFEEEYAKLNDRQRIAVDAIEGPVMVIAGPGTGKTQILSARIGKILLSDAQIEPANILCLTYTDAGVIAMRRRLAGFIGPDAYKVAIYTFHAFCNDVIQDNLSLFEKTALDPVSDLERIELMKELIDGFDKDHPLKRFRGDVYFEISSLQALFSLMKREGWAPDFICQKIDEYLADLPLRDEYICKRATKDFKKGDIRIDKIAEQAEKMEKLRAACNEFTRFQELMRSRSRYDFDDMINWVITAFRDNEALLRAYQEQFQYILVDEYQDTSGSQNALVQLLISFWDKPNIFVVGDDDQSIYRFQGANIENMRAFADDYQKDLLTVVLVNNYRSVQPILDLSKKLIDRNEERLVKHITGLTKDLVSSNEALKNGMHRAVIKEYKTPVEEMIGITTEVEKLLAQGVAGSSIGIIYKENKYGERLADYLRLRGLPYYSRRSLNIVDQPFIGQLLLVLNYLCAEHDIPYSGDEMLFEILHFEWFNIPPVEIAKATMKVAELRYKGQNTSLRQWLYETASRPPADLFDRGLHKGLKAASATVENLIRAFSNQTLQGLLEQVVREGGFLGHIMNHPEKPWLLQLLTGFYNEVKEECRRHPVVTLQEFMNRLDLMRREGLTLPLVQVGGNEKGVNLMTVHGAKGLEFDYVFFAGVTSASWEKKRKPFGGFYYPDTLTQTAAKGDEMEELRRLFYVALTRAKKHLSLSYALDNGEGKTLEPSMFLAEMSEGMEIELEREEPDAAVMEVFSTLYFVQPAAPEVQHLDDDLADRAVASFGMSVSALNCYLKCPLGFYYQHIVRIPSPRNEAMEFGSAIHHALEHLFLKAKDKDRFAPVDELLNDFSWYMNRHRQSFTREQFKRRMEYGSQILTAYYDTYVTGWNKIVSVELNVRTMLDDIPLRGKIDKIEFTGREAAVIDYKTGNPEYAMEKLARPNDKNGAGGDYWRQAVFYKILLDLYPKDWQVKSVEFDFIEPDRKKTYRKEKISISEIDIAIVKAQIREVWLKIQRKDFYTGCGKPDCHWCNFVKTNKLAMALHELKEEEEEPRWSGLKVM